MSLFRELQRRNVLRTAAAYIAVSWVVVQVIETLAGAFGFTEDVALRMAVIALAVGFIPAMVVSWAFELTPEGFKPDSAVRQDTETAKKSARNLDRFVMVALAVALSYFVIDEVFFETSAPITEAERSIAVLPFVNMSPDPDQAYFSDGISEEMLNLLAKIPELRVISRTSAFQYRDTDKEMPQIAKELRVAHVLEGSVRKAGNTIRITAQLVHAPTDAHVWSETWDRQLVDVFAIQDEIAANVVDRIKVELLGPTPTVRKVDPEAYALFLEAEHVSTYGIPGKPNEFARQKAAELYERAIEIEPTYVDAMVRLSFALFELWRSKLTTTDDPLLERVYKLQRRALEIDPDHPLANVYAAWGDDPNTFPPVAETATMIERAYNSAPQNAFVAHMAIVFARSIGRPDIAVDIGQHLVSRDPRNAGSYYLLSLLHREAGMFDQATEAGKIAQALGMRLDFSIATTALYGGDPEPMLALLESEPRQDHQALAMLAVALHSAGRIAESDEKLAILIENYGEQWPIGVATTYAWKGDADAAFEWLELAMERDLLLVLGNVTVPLLEPIRSDPRWEDVLRRLQRHPDQLATLRFDPKIPR